MIGWAMTADVPTALRPLLDILYGHSDGRLAEVKAEGRKFAHYTTAENARNIIAGKSVWLRNAAHVTSTMRTTRAR
jgi:hypothetical protein